MSRKNSFALKAKIFKEETTIYFKRAKEFQLLFAALILSIAILATWSIEPAFAGGKLITDTITSPSLEGNLAGDPATRNIVIYLPPEYDTSGERYPVVYLMPGPGFTERFWPYNEGPELLPAWFALPTDFPKAGFASMIDDLIATGKIQPMIIVMPNLDAKYGGSWGANSALNGNHEDYVVKDIVSYVDATYRTLPGSDSRAIGGHCMGGYVSIYYAMRHPDVFGAVASLCGSLVNMSVLSPGILKMTADESPNGLTGPPIRFPYPDKFCTSDFYMLSAAWSPNPDNPPYYMDLPIDENFQIREDIAQKWEKYDLLKMLPDYVSALASLRGIYIDAGGKDEVGTASGAQAFSDALNAAGIRYRLEIFDGKHLDKMYTRLKVSLSYLSDVLVGGAIPPKDYSKVFFTSLSQGLNMISLPLEPQTPYTARSFAEEIGATVVIRYNESSARFEGFTLDAPGDGFAIEGGKGYIVNVTKGNSVAFTGAAWTNQPPVQAAPIAQTTSAWAFVVNGLALDGEAISAGNGGYKVIVRNLRTGDIATETVDSSGYFATAYADLNRKAVIEAGDGVEVTVVDSNGNIVSGPFVHGVTLNEIRNAAANIQLKLGHIIPEKPALLQNYPNPFNPETWIPYQLRNGADISIRIYTSTGQLVRALELGYKDAGVYVSQSKAAYWDGKNETGEEVASGIYFYSITAGDFSATKKMLVER